MVLSIWSNIYNNSSPTVINSWRPERITNIINFAYQNGYTWDSRHYSNIAEFGYDHVDEHQDEEYAFFPLFPLQIKLVAMITGLAYPIATTIAGFINTILVFWLVHNFFRVYLTKYIPEQLKNLNNIFLLFVLLPFNYFYIFAYTESLFVLLMTAILTYLLHIKIVNKWFCFLPALSYMMGITRSPGIFISLVFVFTFLQINFAKSWADFIINCRLNWKSNLVLVISIIANIAGLLSFLYYGFLKTGNFWISRDVQKFWGRESSGINIFEPIYNGLFELFKQDKCWGYCTQTYIYYYFAFLLILICAWIFYKYFRNNIFNYNFLILSICFTVLPLTTNQLASYNRIFAVSPIYYIIFPIFLVYYIPSRYYDLLIIFLCCLYTVFISLFSLYYWVG